MKLVLRIFGRLSVAGICVMPAIAMSSDAGVLGHPRKVEAVGDVAMGVFLQGDILYCIADDSLYALDISSPLSPKLCGTLQGMDNRRQVVVQGKLAYVASRETGLRIVDVSNPEKMKLLSRFDSVEFATGIEVVGNTVFLSERINGVEAVDVSDPRNPRHICIRKTPESQSVVYHNGFLYSGEWAAGKVTVFDARSMKHFRKVAELQLGGFGDGVTTDGKYLYCSTGHDIPRALRISRGISEEEACGRGRGMDIFDISNPAKPKHVSRIDFPRFMPRDSDYWTSRVSRGFAFCCDSHNGMFVVDVKNPHEPKVIDRLCIPQEGKNWPSAAISSVSVGNGCLYVSTNPCGLWVVPMDGIKPQEVAKGLAPADSSSRDAYPTDLNSFYVYRPSEPGQARTVCLRGNIAYAAFGDAGLHVLEVSTKHNDILKDIADELDVMSDDMGFCLHVDCNEQVVVDGNLSLICSIFRNLTDNAISYSGGKNIYISLISNTKDMCCIRFEDDGLGVGVEQLPRLFERFYRVDKGRSRQNGGTGLGLAIVKHAVQFHGGTIVVTNRPNGGLRFEFSLKK